MDISPAWCSAPSISFPCLAVLAMIWQVPFGCIRMHFKCSKGTPIQRLTVFRYLFSVTNKQNLVVELVGSKYINNPVPYICSLCLDSCVNRKRLPNIFSMLFYILLLFYSIFLLLHLTAVHVRDSLRPPCMVASSRSAEQNYALPRDE